MATIIVLAIIGIFCLIALANAESVKRAFREVRLVQEQQYKHQPWLMTNGVVARSGPVR
jgi:type II secretory pathway pseudopilin PulG